NPAPMPAKAPSLFKRFHQIERMSTGKRPEADSASAQSMRLSGSVGATSASQVPIRVAAAMEILAVMRRSRLGAGSQVRPLMTSSESADPSARVDMLMAATAAAKRSEERRVGQEWM